MFVFFFKRLYLRRDLDVSRELARIVDRILLIIGHLVVKLVAWIFLCGRRRLLL